MGWQFPRDLSGFAHQPPRQPKRPATSRRDRPCAQTLDSDSTSFLERGLLRSGSNRARTRREEVRTRLSRSLRVLNDPNAKPARCSERSICGYTFCSRRPGQFTHRFGRTSSRVATSAGPSADFTVAPRTSQSLRGLHRSLRELHRSLRELHRSLRELHRSLRGPHNPFRKNHCRSATHAWRSGDFTIHSRNSTLCSANFTDAPRRRQAVTR